MSTNANVISSLTASKLSDLLARARAQRDTGNSNLMAEGGLRNQLENINPINSPENPIPVYVPAQATGMHGEVITYNKKQQEFIDLMLTGKSCILLGAAGCGKTTVVQGAIAALIREGKAGFLSAEDHKHLPNTGSPSIVITAFTRRAVSNIRKVVSGDMKNNCVTAHKLLEYQPVYYSVFDETTQAERNTMKFEATRNQIRKLPPLNVIIIEESSMMSVELFNEIVAAESNKAQYIFIGDLNQLPPVFGSAILGHKMLELETIELTEVYRQALESPIIKLAHRILSGNPIPASEYPDWKVEDKLTIRPWKKKITAELALLTIAKFFTTGYDTNLYDPDEDMILIPYNKALGTIELNKHIANHIAHKNSRLIYEVVSGFNKHYFSVGDKVLYEKEDAEIISITPNELYSGAPTQHPSVTLDYWGHDNNEAAQIQSEEEADIDFYLTQIALNTGDSEDRVKMASHKIVVRVQESEVEVTLETASDINQLLLSYALTVHKSQGSEWRKVFLILHQSHATMLQRELLYTAVTRAREELYVICEPETFTNGIKSQRIKGNTLAEKAEYFKGKLENKIQ